MTYRDRVLLGIFFFFICPRILAYFYEYDNYSEKMLEKITVKRFAIYEKVIRKYELNKLAAWIKTWWTPRKLN